MPAAKDDDPRDGLHRRPRAYYAWDAGDAIVASYESVRFLPLATSSAFQIQQARRSLRPGDSTSLRTLSSSRTSLGLVFPVASLPVMGYRSSRV